ncbi:RHS repeat domain-containing protein [Aquimarina sediminis]|uniref:RHS repeat domain-containing protein n=1 Tax=Aquimarina sediminis TaxID=2070536 RepID=UPI000FFE6B11|nr:RHS repeat domain-containing protein [Aquimarina sediminis]
MRHILLMAVLLFTAFSFGQTSSPGTQTDADLIPFPTSPEAGKFGVFGNIPVNLSAGQMNYQIPLHTIQVNGYSWPISLHYGSGGLLLEDKPSLSGMNWNLSAGGTVVREVRGLPDEHPKGYYGTQNYRITHLNPYFNTGEISENTANYIMAGAIDSEPDKYNVSVNGINFSFKIDKDKNPVYISKHNYKVTLSWASGVNHVIDKVTLIDDKGYTYIFDVKERNEPLQGNEAVFNDSFTGYTSSWMLSSVIFPNNEQLSFNYIENSYVSLDFYASGFYSYNIPVIQCTGGDLSNAPLHSYSDGFSKTMIKRKLLTSITSAAGNIFLPVDPNATRIKYNALIINNSENKTVNTYGFEYYGNRDLLTKITKNTKPFYGFEYHQRDLIPDFHTSTTTRPYAQDKWGFYNGIGNTHAINVPFTPYYANKTPNPDKTKIGALTKIIYPTGGYSLIDYEANQIKSKYTADSQQVLPPNRELNMLFKSDNNINSNAYKETAITYEFKTNVFAKITHSITSNNNGTIVASINRTDNCPVSHTAPGGGDYPTVAEYYRSVENTEVPFFCPALGIQLDDNYSGSSKTLSGTSGGYIVIPKGTYVFKIYTNSNKNKDVSGHINVKFHELPEVAPGQQLYVNTIVGGIRVKSIKEYDGSSTNPVQERFFDYSATDGYSSGVELQKGISEMDYKIELTCTNGTHELTYRYDRLNYNYKTYNPVNLNSGVPVYYKQVKEFQDRYTEVIPSYVENPMAPTNYDGSKRLRFLSDPYATKKHFYTKGYTSTTYENPTFFYDIHYPFAPNGVDKSMGRVTNTSVYKFNKTDSLHPAITTTNQSYIQIRGQIDQNGNDNNPLHPKGLKIGYRIKKEGSISWSTNPYDYFHFKTYMEYDNMFLPRVKETIQYYPEQLKTTETNTYDQYDQLSSTEVVDSQGKIHKSETKYPYNSTDAVSTAMVQQNVIAIPISTTTKREGTLLSSSKTEFYNMGGLLFKPKARLSSKGANPLEARLHIDRYDDKGNIVEYHSIAKDDAPASAHRYTSIIWGYNKQYPIAKIENTTFAQLASALGVTEAALLGYDETSLTAIDNLRSTMPGAMITTYTYDPLVGVISTTDPRGYTSTYQYDDLQRLESVKDADGNLVSKNTYHYKN